LFGKIRKLEKLRKLEKSKKIKEYLRNNGKLIVNKIRIKILFAEFEKETGIKN
jgi:hypothetical protein